MKKSYEEPQLSVRKYTLPLGDVITTSNGDPDPENPSNPGGSDLGDGSDHNYFN